MNQPPTRRDRTAELTERKRHLRSIAVAGAIATVGAFAGLAASTDTPTTTQDANGAPPTQAQPSGSAVDAAQNGTPQQADSFSDPQGDFFDGSQTGGGQSAIAPPQGSFDQGRPSMSGSS